MVEVNFVLVEEAHVPGNAHEHILRDVDLHEDQKLEHRPKDVTHEALIDPLTPVDAQKVLRHALLVLLVQDDIARDNSAHREDSKEEVGYEEAL